MEKKTLVPIVGIHSSGKSTILDILNKKGFITQGECAEEIRVTKNVKAGALADSSFEELVKKEELKRDKIRNWKDEKVIFVESWHVLTLSYMLTRGKNIDEIADYINYVKKKQEELNIIYFYLISDPHKILERSRKLHTEEDIGKYYSFYERLNQNIEYVLKKLEANYYEFDTRKNIEETKKDMEQAKPMDRLLCGDVGYGKTEVAIRAAFKAIMDHKQVAYLVPTTVLANQQYEEFKTRMEEFPIKVELLNRFRTKKEQNEVIKKLKLGEIDCVVGTHRILSKDVEFKDLGLLIIDEEHRFGVKDKEKIKVLKNTVDVLTMTATPIPRTLHMSIVGVRDMSVIYEPPHNRKAVQTYVLEYDDEVIKEAITKELERDGQVFYLFNNVEQIEKKANFISDLVPEAKVAYAHGKMSGKELEDIMMEFVKKEVNVLVCTTILESGIDIPNANTIIVENADRLGLAQLYQIRGRVGRSDRQAYAYITYRHDKLLSEVADKRLKAIKEFTEFGSGFKIAMRDLEIRGAGSLLRRNTTWSYGTSWI